MMKYLIFLMALFPFITKGQVVYESLKVHPDIQGDALQWSDWNDSLSQAEKVDLINKIVPSPYLKKFDLQKLNLIDSCHFIDFDGDQLTDIVYSGQYNTKLKKPISVFLKNKGESCELVFKAIGRIASIRRMHGRVKKAKFIILNSANEDRHYHEMTYYFFGKRPSDWPVESAKKWNAQFNSKEFGATKIKRFVYMNNTLFPESMGNMPFTVFREDAYLTIHPGPPTNADFSEDISVFSDLDEKENKAIALVDVSTKVHAIGFTKVNGHMYYFVQLQLNSAEKNYYKGIDCFTYGWLDAEYVRSNGRGM
ncbi:MAG: hypothetical protein MI810_16355 [Flavobacteriales bacterium]|nr:hypothetical protein [Flavobacteriales bacterium]